MPQIGTTIGLIDYSAFHIFDYVTKITCSKTTRFKLMSRLLRKSKVKFVVLYSNMKKILKKDFVELIFAIESSNVSYLDLRIWFDLQVSEQEKNLLQKSIKEF